MKKAFLYIVFFVVVMEAAAQKHYIGQITLSSETHTLRFNALIHPTKKEVILKIVNATDTIELKGISAGRNQWRFDFPVFNTHIVVRKIFDRWVGTFTDADKSEVSPLTFVPVRVGTARYPLDNAQPSEGRFQVIFDLGTDRERKAVLEYFPLSETEIRGSVLTRAGDYRFFQGSVSDDSLIMSTFDGKFAYVLAGRIEGDSIAGYQYFTHAAPRPFVGFRSSDINLPDPKSLIKISDSSSMIRFSLPDVNYKVVNFDATQPDAKLTLITIGGSWCPNCMDEARFLNKIYNRYKDLGLQVIGVYFEYTDKDSVAVPLLRRMVKQLNLDFTVVYGGSVRQQMAAKVFPQLEKILAYPTLIALDADGRIVKTHTGFYGPGTSLYAEFEEEMTSWIEDVLK
ncbi:MAG: TlpA disulfide reductase family protein [Thermaurantimonas sp.]